jgi:hypothetical protein
MSKLQWRKTMPCVGGPMIERDTVSRCGHYRIQGKPSWGWYAYADGNCLNLMGTEGAFPFLTLRDAKKMCQKHSTEKGVTT